MTNETAIVILSELKKCYLGGIVDALDFAIEALKAQKPETSDTPKPDSDIGCWYDITHNYTLEQVVSALKSRELCEDAVSRKYLLDQSYSIKFQTIDESDEEAYREEVVCVEDIEDAPSVQPISVARVMTLEEWREWKQKPLSQRDPVYYVDNKGLGSWINPNDQLFIYATPELGYGVLFVCWTSRPTDEQKEAIPWNAQK